jgi:hypothetical protein
MCCLCVLHRSAEFIIAFNRGIDAAANLLEAGLVAGVVQAKVRQKPGVVLRREGGDGKGRETDGSDSARSKRQLNCFHKAVRGACVLQAVMLGNEGGGQCGVAAKF